MAICVGCGLAINPGTGLLEVERAPGGGLTCTDAGLAVTFPPATTVPGISPDACNGFQLRGNGYYSPCPDATTGIISNDSINNDLLDGAGLGIAAPGGPYLLGSGAPNVIANDKCCEVAGIIAIRAGGLFINANNGFYGDCHLEINANGTGMGPAIPDTSMVFENKSGSNLHSSFNNLVDENHIIIPAFSSITYAAAVVVRVFAGSATLSGFIKFEYVITLPQTGCC